MGAIVVLMAGVVVMAVIVHIVIVTVGMAMIVIAAMFVRIRCLLFQRQWGMVGVTMYAVWLGVQMVGR